jgi:hypothetical protein
VPGRPIYGELYRAQLEQQTSFTAALRGRIGYDTTLLRPILDDGSLVRAILVNDQKCVFGNHATAANNIRFHRGASGVLQFVTGDDTTAEGTLSTSIAQIGVRVGNYAAGSLPASAAGNAGRLSFVTDELVPAFDNGSAWIRFATLTTSQTLTNKTLTTPTLTTPSMSAAQLTDYTVWTGQASGPSSPAAGKYALYFKTDGRLYAKNSAGTETDIAASAVVGYNASYEISNLGLSVTATASSTHTLVIALKTQAGTDPTGSDIVYVGMRSATAATGTYNRRSATGAVSLTVSSGSTLGTISAVAAYLYVYLVDNAGTLELGVSHTYYDEGTILSTTVLAGGGADDSGSALYTTTARANVPIRCVGRFKSTQAAAGTWDTAIAEVSLWPFIPQRVIAIYETDANNGASDSTATTVDFEDRVVDTHGCVTTGTWVFTAPKAMVVHVDCGIQLASSAAWNATEKVVLIIQKNGANHRQIGSFTAESTTTMSIQLVGSCLVSLAAGDTIRAQWTQNTGGGVNLDNNATHNYISIMEHSFV